MELLKLDSMEVAHLNTRHLEEAALWLLSSFPAPKSQCSAMRGLLDSYQQDKFICNYSFTPFTFNQYIWLFLIRPTYYIFSKKS